MKRAFGLVCLVSIIYIASLIIGFFKYSINEQYELQQLLLSYAIDYCSDGAMQEVLTGDDLEMDYSQDGHVIVDPTLSLETFVDMFCLNYDIGVSSDKRVINEARKHILQNYIPVACMACYDGFYIAKYQPIKNAVDVYYPLTPHPTPSGTVLSNSTWDVVFGPKLPYTYINGGTTYALNMGMDYAYAISGLNVSKFSGVPPGLLNKDAGIAKINEILSGDIASTINSANELNPNWKHSFFIPAQLTSLTGASPITGPSLIVLVQNVDLTTARPISGFSISGSKVGKARMVVGYTRGGVKYYCYADRAPSGVTVENLFENVKDAAKNGYYYDSAYMN